VTFRLAAAAVAIGAAHLVAYYGGWRGLAGTLKAVPILLLAARVASEAAGRSGYAGLVAKGLVLSAVGDVSLVFPNGFLAGLASFLVAHLCYIAAFADGLRIGPGAGVVAVVLAAAVGAMLVHLWPHVARVRIPVVVYVATLAVMTWCATTRALAGTGGAAWAAVGAVSFLVSDAVLASDRFARPFSAAHGVVMVTYYAAQLCIATSALT
jgi:uncharacterized membrane protein YhhN